MRVVDGALFNKQTAADPPRAALLYQLLVQGIYGIGWTRELDVIPLDAREH